MDIAILNYQTSTVEKICNCPDTWSITEVEDYLFKTLKYKESEISYMIGKNIKAKERQYEPKEQRTLHERWASIKEKHPDCTLLFRTGDFYEAYSEDAEVVADILNITLTRYNTMKEEDGQPLRLAGFPYSALDTYLPKLIRAGLRIAICDNLD